MTSPSNSPYRDAELLASRIRAGETVPLSELLSFLLASDARILLDQKIENKKHPLSESEIDFL
jgi:hypothetical protein